MVISTKELPQLDKPLRDLSVIAYRTALGLNGIFKPLKYIIQLFAKFEHIEVYLDGKICYSSAKTTQFTDLKKHWTEYLLPATKVYIWELISEPTDWQKEKAKEYINSRIGRGYNVSGAMASVMGGGLFKVFKAFLRYFGKDLDKKKEDYCSSVSINSLVEALIIRRPKDTQISPKEAIRLVENSGKYKPRIRIR